MREREREREKESERDRVCVYNQILNTGKNNKVKEREKEVLDFGFFVFNGISTLANYLMHKLSL